MFLVGIELRTYSKSTSTSGHHCAAGALCGAPIVVCAAAAWPFAHQLVGPRGNSLQAWVFVGVALSVTAVPVSCCSSKIRGPSAHPQRSGCELPSR